MSEEILKLKKEIERLKKSVKKQRYGLVWMDVPEAFEDDVENKLPILKEVPELAIKNNDGKQTHILIEGDNYHALTCLNYTHKGKIDVIYIDPPYNTGSDGFRYKDKRILDKFPDGTEVPKDNPFRHSYWLSFMQKRLDLVRDLLSKNGVVFISIDDNEMAQLKLLCDSIFGDNNVEVMIWHKVADDSGKLKITYRFRREHEYIIVCYKQKDETYFKKYLSDRNYKNEYTNPDNDPRGPYKQGIISTTEAKSKSTGKNFYSVKTPSGKIITRQWRFPKEEFESLDKDNRIYYGKGGSSIPSEKVFINEQKETTPTSILTELGTAKSAGIELEELMGSKIFNYPKPVTLIKHLIKMSSEKNSVILDFFAGSGTTGQAVAESNKDDDGNRQFILVTNNDEVVNGKMHKIMSGICYPRIKKVAKLYKNGAKYYKTAFIGKNSILNATDQDKIELAHNAGELLAIAENTLELTKQNKFYQLFEDGNKEKYTAVYFREELDKFDEFTEIVKKLKKQTAVYVFSWGNEEEVEEFNDMNQIKIKTIPLPILEIYKQIYNLSTE
ncbi:site-specific DNA-methyltransferase [Patescibacteria group bacterium]|nr:site-specific DNA-methyltransferase [Patescibacteria group bacterium]MBU0880482.1 site-specific DNA-methyltransferase [Patescibacteria group bacterium]MBU1783183.1 site-specific DNA-methyltransferase [Patescibacteria group bacterium]MBU1991494.1 site-specific DNA-methyltransferase [Patescibacteria group bacterium]MBU2081292.1 site-specific DNA-methyltransferase [Patescibacteria group bacterium]